MIRTLNSQSSIAICRHRPKVTRPRNSSEVSTSAANTVEPAECRLLAPSNPSAIKPADTAPMKMLARPFTSLIVAARCIPRL
jgi:hypothetical protein